MRCDATLPVAAWWETSCAFGVAGKQPGGLRPKETTMWYRAVGCLVTLTLSLLVAPLAAEAQPSAKVATIGYLSMIGGAPGVSPPGPAQ